jgi:hypothetical protein
MKTSAVHKLACALLVAILLAPAARSAADDVFTIDLPFDASLPLPQWMHGPPVAAPGVGARVAFRLSPPAERDLLVHFVFDEADGSGLRVEWLRDGQSTPEVLAENLGEGLGVPNQRPLLISASRLGGNGSLLLQGGANLNVNRVRFEWVAERTLLSTSARYVPVVVTASRLTLAEADVDGQPRPALQDEWSERIVRAPLTESAELLTSSIEVRTNLEQAPVLARLEASFSGVYLDQEVWLVVNNQELGPMAIEVPTLQDPGHLGTPGREVVFAGWRRASMHIPSHLLMPGENSILLELRSPVNADYRNRTFVRESVLELAYPRSQREPDLSLPLADLPEVAELHVDGEPPLPPLAPPGQPAPAPEAPAGALEQFWNSGAGSF